MKNITISSIQECVSIATKIKIDDILMNDKIKGARKREKINARHLSMSLSKKYTNHSLAYIGTAHGGRDHATVLHACSTISNLIDTKDQLTIDNYHKAEKNILTKIASINSYKRFRRYLPISVHGKRCSYCGNKINSYKFKSVY
jgi:hypothetical protein